MAGFLLVANKRHSATSQQNDAYSKSGIAMRILDLLTSGRSQYVGFPLRILVVTPMGNHFSVNGLARHFRVNPKAIYRRLWAKEIPSYKVGRVWRIARKDIKWLRQ